MNTNEFTIPNAVQWHEGMMLSPQHFQQEQIVNERIRRHQMNQITPYFWGIYNLDVQVDELRKGIFRINNIHCVFQDGLIVEYARPIEKTYEDAFDKNLELSLDELELEPNKEYFIYLVVPKRTKDSASKDASIRRFSSVEDLSVTDENTGQDQLSISRLRPNLSLACGKIEPRYENLILCKIRKINDGEYENVVDYYPPLLTVTGGKVLGKDSPGTILAKVLQDIREKAENLHDIDKRSNTGSESLVSSVQKQRIYHLMRELPSLEIAVQGGASHPYILYQDFARLAAEISNLSNQSVPPKPKPYNHKDMWDGFRVLVKSIQDTVNNIKESFTTFNFKMKHPGYFSFPLSEFPEGYLDKPNPYILVELHAGANQTPEDLVDWMNACRIACTDPFNNLEKMRSTGMFRKRILKEKTMNIVAMPNRPLFALYDSDPKKSVVSRLTAKKELEFMKTDQELIISCDNENLLEKTPQSILIFVPQDLK